MAARNPPNPSVGVPVLSATAKEEPKPAGTMIGGYTLLEEVGRGGMGSVYRATAPDGSVVAVKLLASSLTENFTLLQRFQQEARLAKRVEHPSLVKAIELGEEDGVHFFAMEFVDGESVGQRLKRVRKIQPAEAVRICIAVAEALDAAHQTGLVHRDVKPDNILLTRSGDVKLADMGLAKDTAGEDLNLTKTGRGLGTPHFMAPEQFKHAKSADARCDVYSLGATLYMMVTGQLPFKAGNPLDAFIKKSQNEYAPPEELVPELPPRVVRVIKKAMFADPKERPQDMRSLIALFMQSLEGADVKKSEADDPIWYVVYRDANGERKKVKGQQSLIVQLIQTGKIAGDALVAREKGADFSPIVEQPIFAPHVLAKSDNRTVESAAAPPAGQPSSEQTEAPARPPSIVSSPFLTAPGGRPRPLTVAMPPPKETKLWVYVVIALVAVAVLVIGAFFAGRMFK